MLLLVLFHNFIKEWKLAVPLSVQFPFEVLKDFVKALTSHLRGYCHQYLSMILEILKTKLPYRKSNNSGFILICPTVNKC